MAFRFIIKLEFRILALLRGSNWRTPEKNPMVLHSLLSREELAQNIRHWLAWFKRYNENWANVNCNVDRSIVVDFGGQVVFSNRRLV